uniref:Ig-like domain-containing protein n=1 Tax=Anguilla anguilla TaxID=7936 RepID=A0A0E9UFJ7_ANGAN
MMLRCLLLLFSAMVDGSFQDEITPTAKEVHVLEGNSVSLSCAYTAATSTLFWYRQYSRSKPEFLISVVSTDKTEGQFTAKH